MRGRVSLLGRTVYAFCAGSLAKICSFRGARLTEAAYSEMVFDRLGGSGLAAAVIFATALLGSSCAASESISAAPAASPSTSVDGPASGQPPGAGAEKVARPADPAAPATYQPVQRNGKTPKPTIKAGEGSFSKVDVVKYSDGVWLRVDQVRQGVEKGQGPGTFPGRAYTAISFSLHNRSSRTVDLTQVVVTAAYGSPARLATPVYEDAAARDFDAQVKADGTASATYVFAIPPQQRGKVGITVDFDDVHVAARFVGAAG